jgi:nitrite reductase (NO-forming)
MGTRIKHTTSRALGVVAALGLVVGLGACADVTPAVQRSASEPAAAAAPQAAPTSAPAAAAAPAAEGVLDTITVRGGDLFFEPAEVTVAQPGRYAVTLINEGALPHDITFDDGTRIVANPGATASGEVTIPEGGMGYICAIAGHKEAGMVGRVLVEGQAPPAAEPGAGHSHDGHGGGPVATTVEADPDAPAPARYDPAAPALLEGTVHEIVLETIEKEMVVADGFVQKVWTFGGTVPGPVIRVKVGDTVRIQLKNPAGSELPHSVDFHSSLVAHNDEMTDIMPGEEKIYEWKAEYAGVWMYHCGTAPALHHIANGMYGMVIVEPAEGLPAVDKEFAVVQSEWYLGPQGEVSSLEKAASAAPAPDFVLFNGVANQYKAEPIKVETGERVRVFVLNAGPSVDSAFHIVGTIFDTVIKEGVKLERGNQGNWGSQAVDLAPAQGAIVEFSLAEDGLYPMVTHAFNFVGRGALGLFQAGDGDPKN